jgi:hypothetical protein
MASNYSSLPKVLQHVKKSLYNQPKPYFEEDNNKEPMNKPYNIQNTNICNGIFHISFFKALLINEGETTRGKRELGRSDPG